ncbi:MAG: prepilin-type N-terminal cleavage/methylation domain-containing protein [Burkholderiaceae bacterium]|nr:prepilin-type N-terminal cleavage/methylation domain-containing protein [Burkholderiaceae bacterium]
MVSRRQAGFSMVELMVTVTIMLLLALATTPFTRAWADKAAVQQTQGQMRQALAQLRSQALRNASAASTGPAAVLVSLQGRLCVFSGAPATLSCESAGWSAVPPAAITVNEATSQCLALDSAGLPLSSTIGDTACATDFVYKISRGAENPDGQAF